MRADLNALRNLRRGKVHGGYVWAAIMDDGELVCSKCVDSEYDIIYRSTYSRIRSGWMCVGVTYSGESETDESCSHCYRTIWEIES